MTERSTYALIAGREADGSRVFLTCADAEGERALALYESGEAAEAHLMLGNLGPEWGVVEGPKEELDVLLCEVVAPHIPYVTMNPPLALQDCPAVEIEAIPVEEFVERPS